MPVPHQLGYFELQEEIGHGGMGSVWRAKDPTLNRDVAIKVLRDEIASDPKFVADFLQEARNAAAISHPHIAQVHLVGEVGGQYYIVMELLRGHSLRQVLETEGHLDEERALDIAIQVAAALRAAYTQRMIHGDIKPANIFITEDQGAKVLDFGLAKLANVEVTDTGGGIWGSPYYISPERVGQKAEDFRSDVYSLGATLFHALTGRPPFDAEDPAQLALKRLNEKPPLLRDIDPKITAKTEQVVNKMLNKSIMMRYLDYDALLKDLGEAKTEATAKRLGIDMHALDHLQPPAPVAPPPKKEFTSIIIGASIAVVAIVAAVGIVLWQNSRTPKQPIPQPQPQPETPTQVTTPTAPELQADNLTLRIPASDARFRYEGRFDFANSNAPVVIWQASRISIDFEGNALRLLFDDAKWQCFFNAQVDGSNTIVEIREGKPAQPTVLSGFGAGRHHLTLFKRSEADAGTVHFSGIEIAPASKAWLPAPPNYKLAMEFIGDSITAGACNEDGATDQWDNRRTQNCALSFATLTADAFNADYRNIAVSGMGVATGWVEKKAGEIWDRIYPNADSPRADLSKWTPQVVFVNCGDEDDSYARVHQQPFPAGFADSYISLIQAIRRAYPGAQIVLLRGGMVGSVYSEPLRVAWEAAVKRLEANDANISHFVFKHWAQNHPRVADHRAMADELVAWLKEQKFMRAHL